ncbi:MAG TPA: gentisate 1,2-dioxygenase, partial [Steroidobacteraceae bacterium]|nr:gentisate 1,2-dioxygenase [Steroidobacteraceae bacterium]
DLYARMNAKNLAPLWEVLSRLVPSEPHPTCVPAWWSFDRDIRPLLLEAGGLISAKQAERRVAILQNPGIGALSQITQSLYAGVQLLMPGEVAPSHRHTASAIRFVLEGEGAYTAVEGERASMHPGDFILTPSGTFHDHGNPGSEPVMWLDGLDVPIVNLFDTSFSAHLDVGTQPLARKEGDALARYGANMLPVEYESLGRSAPVFTYPYTRSREALETLGRNGPIDPWHGIKMQYVNPVTGGYPMPTIAAYLQLLPAGFRGEASRSTDSTIYCVAEGHGRSHVGTAEFAWSPRDIFVVPSWTMVSHDADEEAVLFSFSDRAAQKALGLWREAKS